MKKILLIDSQEDLEPRRQLFFKTLLENGYQVKALMWDRSGERPVREEKDGILFERVNVKANYADLKSAYKIWPIYYKFFTRIVREEFDVVLCGHFFLLPLAVAVGEVKNAKIVYDVMEYYVHDFFGRLPNSLKWLDAVAYPIENLFVKMIDGITTIPSYQNFLLERYKKYNANVEEIKNVPISINGNLNKGEHEGARETDKSEEVIIYTGTISEEWGILKLLKSIIIVKEQFPWIKLLIAGKTRKNYENVISKFVASKKIEDSVSFIGFIPYSELSVYLDMALVGVVPMQPVNKFKLVGNGTSRKIFEYMNAGLPVVASDFGELAQVVKEENCGILVDSTKPDQIAEAIIYLLKNPNIAREMGERGRKAVEEKYNWQMESRKLLRVYDNLWR